MKTSIFFFLFMLCFSEINALDSMWYHPNPWWKVARENTPVTKNAFPYRQALPQFGYPSRWTGDGWDNSIWTWWADYNKMTAPHKLVGHSWQVFMQQNAELLKKNPQFLAEIKGERLGYGKASKLCVSNKQLQRLFAENARERFAKQADLNGYVSVEPSDGAGHCECNECQKMGSISTRVFYLANLAAKAVREKYPKGGVNLYAYYFHSDTPSVRLEPNVHVTVIPNGFQALYDGDVLMYLWKKKTNNLSYYDYIAIPQWKGELPRIHIQNFLRKIAIAKKLKYKGFWHEVGLNLPATISIQLMSQLWRNPSLTWQQVYNNFIKDCFPNARIPMKRLFDRWFNEWKGDEEVILAFRDIQEAEAKPLNIMEKKRLADIKAYLLYISAYQEWRRNENPETTQQFFDMVFGIADRQVVNTGALFQLFGSKIKDPDAKTKYTNFIANKNSKLIAWSDTQIDKLLINYNKSFQQTIAGSKKMIAAKTSKVKVISFKYENTVVIEGTGQAMDLNIRSVDYAVSRDGLQNISIVNDKGDLVFNGIFPLEKTIHFNSKKGTKYRLAVKQIFNSFLTINPDKVITTLE